jgi:hypothetical protein
MSIESLITDLIGALDRNTAAHSFGAAPETSATEQTGTAAEPARRGRKPKTAEQPATTGAAAMASTAQAPATGASAAPASGAGVAAPGGATLLKTMTDAVITLANDYSRDEAKAILAKFNVIKCSEVPAAHWAEVLGLANAAIETAKAAQENASLV